MAKRMLILLMGLVLVVGMAACSSSETSKNEKEEVRELVIADWGGTGREAYRKAFYDSFEKEFNVKITSVNMDYGKFTAMVEAGGEPEWDIVAIEKDFSIRGGNKGLLEKLDYNVINAENLLPGNVFEYGVNMMMVPVSIGYNETKFKGEYPQTWAEFWDTEKFPGDRALWNYPTFTLETALLADGVKPDELYPLDVDRAFESLAKIKDDVTVWWDSGAQHRQLLQSGEVAASAVWSASALLAQVDGAPVDVEYNQSVLAGETWGVAKGTPNKDLAMEFINHTLDPERLAQVSEILYFPMNDPRYYDYLSDEAKEILPTPEEMESFIVMDAEWWVENFDEVNERWQKFLLE